MNDIPDATTVAIFRERMRKAGVIEELFEMFEAYLWSQGLQALVGEIIYATLVPVQGRLKVLSCRAHGHASKSEECLDVVAQFLLACLHPGLTESRFIPFLQR